MANSPPNSPPTGSRPDPNPEFTTDLASGPMGPYGALWAQPRKPRGAGSQGRVAGGRFVSRGMEIGNSSNPHLHQTGNLHGNSTRPGRSPWKPQMECPWRPPWCITSAPAPLQRIPIGNPHGEGKSPWGILMRLMSNPHGNPHGEFMGFPIGARILSGNP